MTSHQEFQAANDQYIASFGDKGSLPLPPAKKVIVSPRRPYRSEKKELINETAVVNGFFDFHAEIV